MAAVWRALRRRSIMLGSGYRFSPPDRMTSSNHNRAFLSQDLLDGWLADECISLDGDVLKLLPKGPAFLLTTAAYFQSEVTTGEDPLELCGKVKALAQIAELGGEHVPGSVVIGDSAYEVRDGFLGELLPEHPDSPGDVPAGVEHGRWALAELAKLAGAAEVG